MAKFAIEHRWRVAVASLAFLLLSGMLFKQLKSSFFPDDVQYWSYIDVWLPNDVNLQATQDAAKQVESIVRQQAEKWGKEHPGKDGKPSDTLALRDHVGRRGKPTLLVLAIAAGPTVELRAGAG